MNPIFREVKERVTTRDALAYLNIAVTKIEHGKEGEQLRCQCPNCKDKDKRGLSINTATGKFQCFARKGCIKGNDIISLVHAVENCSNTEAAERLKAHFISASRSSSSTEPGQATARSTGRGSDTSGAVASPPTHPLALLGMSEEVARILDVQEDDGCLVFTQRSVNGVDYGTLRIGLRPDVQLIKWVEHVQEHDSGPTDLKALWRVVKGGA